MYCILSPGDVAGQLTGLPPTCPGYTFTFRCTVTGNMSGETRWRVGGNSECALQHSFSSITTCGPDSAFRARSRTGFGTTSATSFTSTLSGTALNGTLVECFGPARNVNPGNRVGSSRLSIIGQYHKSKFEGAVMHSSVTLSSYISFIDTHLHSTTNLSLWCKSLNKQCSDRQLSHNRCISRREMFVND